MYNHKGKNNPRYIDGRTNKKYFCKDCSNPIHKTTALRGKGRCVLCSKIGKLNPFYGKGRKGVDSPTWNGGTSKSKGYVEIYSPNHPHKNKRNYVLEHRLVIEKKLGRYLESFEIVHHLNGIKDDNREENLSLLTKNTHSAHLQLQEAQRRILELEKTICILNKGNEL